MTAAVILTHELVDDVELVNREPVRTSFSLGMTKISVLFVLESYRVVRAWKVCVPIRKAENQSTGRIGPIRCALVIPLSTSAVCDGGFRNQARC